MKRIILMLVCSLLAIACSKEDIPTVVPEPQVPVTFTNTSGDWTLKTWKGTEMEAGSVVINFKDKKFVLLQSVGSMYPVEYTGTYNLIEEDGVGTIIRGLYDYTYEYWEHMYIVTSLTANTMTWVSQDDPEDVYEYVRKTE